MLIDTALAEQEAIIERGLATFVEVGTALQVIRDRRLHPQGEFGDYCVERWGLTRQRTSVLMAAAEMSAFADIPNEAIARQLQPVLIKNGATAVAAVMAAVEAAGPHGGR